MQDFDEIPSRLQGWRASTSRMRSGPSTAWISARPTLAQTSCFSNH